jgi:Bacteriocin-protection, YdeI or OmpD-Associated
MENPLIKKLHIKEGMKVTVINAPEAYIKTLGKLPKNVKIETGPKGLFDLVHLFVRNKAELSRMVQSAAGLLKPDASFWISYPKKSSKVKTDLSRDESWAIMAEMNFEGVSLVSIDGTWSAGRFKPVESAVRRQERSAEDIQYIDMEERIVNIPTDLKSAFAKNKDAYIFFETLSFTNRKEYVRWIIDAKREETRKERVVKTISKLEEGKKNPGEK